MTHTAKHRLDLLHVLLIVMISCAALIVLAGAVQLALQLPIELE